MLDVRSRWITVKEAAEVIGVHKDVVYRLIKKEGLPARKVTTGRLRINETALHDWMASREEAT